MDHHQRKQAIIIAMKGHPGTGKSTLARALSSALRLPLLDKDDIRTPTIPLQFLQVPPSVLNDLSYSVLFEIARTQLSLDISVILDSPLSRRAHLDKVVQLAGECEARVVIVECRAEDEEEWRRRVEERGRGGGADGHKPATWEEMERLLEGYEGCWEYEVGEVERIVVDTTVAGEEVGAVVDRVLEFIKNISV